MNDLNINKGFEAMIPKPKQKTKEALFKNNISFKIFNKRFTLNIEVK